MRSLAQVVVGRLAVDGVDHYFLGGNGLHGGQPWRHIVVAGIVNIDLFALSIGRIAFHEHSLDNDVPVEKLHVLNHLLHIIARLGGAVNGQDVIGVHRVELQDVVVHFHQSTPRLLMPDEGRVAQYADLGAGAPLVAQLDCVVDDFGEMRVARWLAVAGKCQHVRVLAVVVHLDELSFQGIGHLLS